MAKNFQKSEVKKAIKNSGGYITNVAKKLNCDWHTAKRYIDKHDLSEDLIAEDEQLNDLTEMKLMENIRNNDTTSIIFRLKTKGKNRGYIEKHQVDHTTKGKSLNEKQFDFSQLSKEEKKQYKDLLLKMKPEEDE